MLWVVCWAQRQTLDWVQGLAGAVQPLGASLGWLPVAGGDQGGEAVPAVGLLALHLHVSASAAAAVVVVLVVAVLAALLAGAAVAAGQHVCAWPASQA